MKLIIQIPCFNEADTLQETLAQLPRAIRGFTSVEILIVDDGSSDDTSNVAWQNRADHVVRMERHSGLAQAYTFGLDAAYADIFGAIEKVLVAGYRTADIMSPGKKQVGTVEMGDLVAERI